MVCCCYLNFDRPEPACRTANSHIFNYYFGVGDADSDKLAQIFSKLDVDCQTTALTFLAGCLSGNLQTLPRTKAQMPETSPLNFFLSKLVLFNDICKSHKKSLANVTGVSVSTIGRVFDDKSEAQLAHQKPQKRNEKKDANRLLIVEFLDKHVPTKSGTNYRVLRISWNECWLRYREWCVEEVMLEDSW